MLKYYYTDPLKAAWMLKYHNLKLEEFYEEVIEIVEESNPNQRYYIHPNCHEMLKPQERDIFKYCGIIGEVIDVEITETGERMYKITGAAGIPMSEVEIIQRNGKAFFMPEVE